MMMEEIVQKISGTEANPQLLKAMVILPDEIGWRHTWWSCKKKKTFFYTSSEHQLQVISSYCDFIQLQLPYYLII